MSSLDVSGGATAAAGRLSIRVTALCWFLVLLDGLDLFVYGASLPGVLADKGFGLTPAIAGDIGSLNTFGMLLGALTSGLITDRVGRRRIIITSVLIFSAAAAVCGMAPTVVVFGAARFVAGVGLGGLLPTAISMVMEYAPAHRKNLSVTVLMTAHQAGGALAGALAMSIVESLGWRAVYWLGALPVLVALPAAFLLLPESITYLLGAGRTDKAKAIADKFGVPLATFAPGPVTRRRWGNVAALYTPSLWRTTLLFWIASFFGLLLVYGVNTWLPTMMRGHGYHLGSAISFLLVINLGGIVGMLVAGRLADRFGPRPVTITWFAITTVGIGLLSIHMPLAITYVDVFLTGGFLFSAQTLIYASVGTYYPIGDRATALGWVSGMGRFGAVFGPWFGGVLVAHQLSTWGFAVFAVASVIAATMIGFIPRRPVAAAPSLSPSAEPQLS
ncbi:aromatic acid/H+ symport family MFS transporter [Nocardia sp. NBC_00565]|uniref:MFS transporter n=1 Tax=Nocardia sp. NBC_00565 TaxID=2975993 RepID=UPI002E820478|nr:aromatic acid/H+ symport family MFS transporter [Nocardia sp. NBC_00565]WUC03382.1 aromatic acid/H+ symport family MFS transporter [Nocardia sp. NBC_00565]